MRDRGQAAPARHSSTSPPYASRQLGAGDAGRYNAAMVAPAASRHVSRDENHLAWDPAIPPVARVASGEVVEFD